jgi:elongator complex protein 6
MSQIPHLLSPYLALPSESSLILLTSVLGASTNWLLLRYLQSFLRHRSADVAGNGGAEKEDVKVLLVSFMRDWAFWKEGGRRLVRSAPASNATTGGDALEIIADVGL